MTAWRNAAGATSERIFISWPPDDSINENIPGAADLSVRRFDNARVARERGNPDVHERDLACPNGAMPGIAFIGGCTLNFGKRSADREPFTEGPRSSFSAIFDNKHARHCGQEQGCQDGKPRCDAPHCVALPRAVQRWSSPGGDRRRSRLANTGCGDWRNDGLDLAAVELQLM